MCHVRLSAFVQKTLNYHLWNAWLLRLQILYNYTQVLFLHFSLIHNHKNSYSVNYRRFTAHYFNDILMISWWLIDRNLHQIWRDWYMYTSHGKRLAQFMLEWNLQIGPLWNTVTFIKNCMSKIFFKYFKHLNLIWIWLISCWQKI